MAHGRARAARRRRRRVRDRDRRARTAAPRKARRARLHLHASGPTARSRRVRRLPGRPRGDPRPRRRVGAAPRAASCDTESAQDTVRPPVPWIGDDRLRLFLGLRLPDDVVDALVAWAAARSRAPRGRLVPPEHLHVTLAFLGSPPAGELDAIVDALRERAGPADPSSSRPLAARRGASACSSSTTTAARRRLARDLHARLEALGVYERRGAPLAPARHRRSASASGPACGRRCRRSGRSLRPMPLLTYPVCTRRARGTRSSSRPSRRRMRMNREQALDARSVRSSGSSARARS